MNNKQKIVIGITSVIVIVLVIFIYNQDFKTKSTEAETIISNTPKCTTRYGQEGRIINGVCKSLGCITRPGSTNC